MRMLDPEENKPRKRSRQPQFWFHVWCHGGRWSLAVL